MSTNSTRKLKFEDTLNEFESRLKQMVNCRGSKTANPFIIADILSDISESDEEDDASLSEEDNTQDNCADFTVHGRCLGNHPNMEVTLSHTLNQTKLNDMTFNQTLNDTLNNLGKLDWRSQLSTLPKWVAELWLNRCSKACEDKGVPVQKDPVGNQLPNLIDISMAARPSAIVKRLTSTVHNSSMNSSLLNTSSSAAYTTKIRIQQNVQRLNTTLLSVSTVADPASLAVDHWFLVRLSYGKICIEGQNVRTRQLTRSGPVGRVLSPRRVETTDNIVYNLVGAIHEDENMPSFVEKTFASGFPGNWKSWVKKWHDSMQTDDEEEDEIPHIPQSKPKTSTPSKKQTASKPPKSKARAKKGSSRDTDGFLIPQKFTPAKTRQTLNKTAVKKTPEVKEKETKKITKPKTSKTVQTSTITPVKPKERRKTAVVAPRCSVSLKKLGSKEILSSTKKSRSSPKINKKILTKWRPVLGTTIDALKVAGSLTDSQGKVIENDHISPLILKRLDSAQLETEHGVFYILSGPPHLPITHNGVVQMPTDIREKFAQGFPYNWLGVVKEWHVLLKIVNSSPKTVRNRQTLDKTSKLNSTKNKQNVLKEDKGKRKLEINSKEIAGVKITTSRRGRRVLKPLKYWENEKLIIDGQKSFCRRGDQYHLLNHSDLQSSEESEKEIESPDMKAQKRKGSSKVEEEQPVKAKKAKVTAKVPAEKAPAKKKAAPAAKNTKKDATTKSRSKAAPKNGLKEVVVKSAPVKKTVKPKLREYDEEEIVNVLSNPVSTLKQRSKKEKIMKQMQEKNTHRVQDFFGCSGMSTDEDLSDTAWDADSVSSKVTTSDDDRMRFNYTPPAARMCLLVSKNTPSPHKLDDPFESASKERDHRTLAFVHRQLSKPKNLLTKKQRDEQKAAAEEAARISKMKYQCSINKEGSKLANQLFKEMTSQEISTEKVNNFLRSSPQHKTNESDSEVEKYYTDEGEADVTEL